MRIEPIGKPQPTFGWSINRQTTRYGKTLCNATTYERDNGIRLFVTEKFVDGKLVEKTKTLFGQGWQVLKKKIVNLKGANNV